MQLRRLMIVLAICIVGLVVAALVCTVLGRTYKWGLFGILSFLTGTI